MKNFVHVLFNVLLLSSCQRGSEKEKLLPELYGHWLPAGYTTDSGNTADFKPMHMFGQLEQGFSFDSNGIADVKRGYFKVRSAKEMRDRRYIFLGTKTKYYVKGDSLKIFNLSDSTWWGLKIVKLSKDTLLFHYKPNVNWTFVRKEYQLESVPSFDKIAVSCSGCYGGTCQISNTIVSSDGEVTFFGEGYTTKMGYFAGTVPKKLYQELEDNFRKAGIESLLNEYHSGYTDGETLTVTFTKGDSIYKTIINGNDGPNELAWAYQPFRYIYQSVDLKPLPESKLPYYPAFHYLKFEEGERELVLPQSESFLLWDYLRKGKVTEESFERRFEMSYEKNSNVSTWGVGMVKEFDKEAVKRVKEIVTDGRYFRFDIDGKEPLTVDIGFNFFDRNYSMTDFKKKDEY